MTYSRTILAVVLISLFATPVLAQFSLSLPNIHVNIPVSHERQQGRCRWMVVRTEQGSQQEWFCRDQNGEWQQQPNPYSANASSPEAPQYDAPSTNYQGASSANSGQSVLATQEPPPRPLPVRVPDSPLARKLDAVVQVDSRSWMMNRYDVGSMTNAEIVAQSKKAHTVTYRGNYTYNQGSPGWVEVKMKGDDIDCIEFWDDGQCRPLGDSVSMRVMQKAMTEPSNGGGGSYGSSDNSDNSEANDFAMQHAMEQQRNDPQYQPTPLPEPEPQPSPLGW